MDTPHISYSLRLQLAGETVHIVGRRDRIQVCNYITLIMQACYADLQMGWFISTKCGTLLTHW